MAKEPLCGNQPADLSLVIAVLRFPPCFVILPSFFSETGRLLFIERNIFDFL
jgi:hypothetical protein